MRILHLISSSGLFGAERVLLELSKGLKKFESCCPIAGVIRNSNNPHVEVAEEANASGIDTVIFPCKGQFDFSLVSLIRKYIKENRVDIIHCHGYKSNFFGLLASRGKIPLVTTNHNWLTAHWKLKVYCFIDSLLIRYFDRIVAVSEDVKKDMLRYKIPERKIRIIDNGIDLDRFNGKVYPVNIRKEFGIKEHETVIGTIGSLGHEKGHIYLLKAAREILETHKAVKFLIIGDGLLRNELESMANTLGISSNVIFAGYRKDIPEMLSMMDIFVLPSIKEGLPMVLLEAMAAKKPVIATRVGAVPKVITHDETGILVRPKEIDELRHSILRLINDRATAEKLRQAAYRRLRDNFTSDTMAGKYMLLYSQSKR
ncbi:MAG: glycosyltransferase family 4 protein [Nitrospirae bacterium]|nr:glycosyltransferase family 4 protein [Nitrospirota bacterium]